MTSILMLVNLSAAGRLTRRGPVTAAGVKDHQSKVLLALGVIIGLAARVTLSVLLPQDHLLGPVPDQEAGPAHELVGALRDHLDGELVVGD